MQIVAQTVLKRWNISILVSHCCYARTDWEGVNMVDNIRVSSVKKWIRPRMGERDSPLCGGVGFLENPTYRPCFLKEDKEHAQLLPVTSNQL